jgi:hypothetical protein
MKAFPNGIITNKDGLIVGGQDGMDLRDYFAAKAMQGMFANSATKQVERTDLPIFAKVCYEMADAMMEARSK